MNLKQKRKFVAEYAKKANAILQEVKDTNPEFITNRWNAVLSKSKYATKKGKFRQSAPYKMNTEEVKKFMEILSNFVRDMEKKKQEKEKYNNAGYSYAYSIIDSLAKEFYNYFYAGDYDEFYDQTMTVLQNMAEDGIPEEDAIHIIENAFYSQGNNSAGKKDKPNIAGYISEISQGGKYL